ncbi:MAG: ribonucleotide reductase [Rhodospirillales bacterium]|jgi:hypothetical protein|nr:ribonucleotide reductase [Rhodospirillales bacterium]
MPDHRASLPDRRRLEATRIYYPGEAGHSIHIQVGFYDDGRPGEVFLTGGGVHGTGMEMTLKDLGVLLSHMFQRGILPQYLATRVGREANLPTPSGRPASVIGAILDEIVAMLEEKEAA